jgi:CheY-like chemotaxis protein
MNVQIQKHRFVAQPVSDEKFADILAILGDDILYEYKSERNMIMAKEKEMVFENQVDTFVKNMVPYISKPIFPEKMILKEYRQRLEKKNKYK